MGLVYGFIGMGFAMIFRATGVVNFAQGELMMLVAYIGFTLVGTFKLGFWALLLASIGVSVLIGLLVEVLLIRPMLGSSPARRQPDASPNARSGPPPIVSLPPRQPA